MSDWPPQLGLAHWSPVINTWTYLLGPVGAGRFGGGFTSTTWPAANRAIYIPVLIPCLMTVTQFYHYNGSTASGNIDIGLYNVDYTRIVSSGATAQAGTTTLQTVDITDTQVPAGIYYIGISFSGTTGTSATSAVNGRTPGLLGIVMQESAHPLPSVMTPVTAASGTTIPLVGLTDRAAF
jgi:hypothetical protein